MISVFLTLIPFRSGPNTRSGLPNDGVNHTDHTGYFSFRSIISCLNLNFIVQSMLQQTCQKHKKRGKRPAFFDSIKLRIYEYNYLIKSNKLCCPILANAACAALRFVNCACKSVINAARSASPSRDTSLSIANFRAPTTSI